MTIESLTARKAQLERKKKDYQAAGPARAQDLARVTLHLAEVEEALAELQAKQKKE